MLVRQQTMLTGTAGFRPLLADWTRRSDLSTLIAASRQALGDDLRPLLARSDSPALIPFAHDPAMDMPVEMLQDVYETQYASLPAHRTMVIENSFHFIPVDRPAAFAEAVVDFVRGLTAETAETAGTPATDAVAQRNEEGRS